MSARDLADLEQARRNARLAKQRMLGTSTALKQRLTPASLAAQAKDTARAKACSAGEKLSGAMNKRPIATSALAGIAGLIVFRKPLGKLRRALFSRKPKTQAEPDGRDDRDGIMRAGEPPKASVTPRIRRAVSQSNAAALEALNKE